MALTQADLDRLDSAIATSELEVEVEGRRVRYRTISELVAARAHVAAVVTSGAASSTGPVRTAFYPRMALSRERY